MNIAWRVTRRDRPQMLSCMNLRITGTGFKCPRSRICGSQVNGRLLMPVDPARDEKEEEGERGRRRVHCGSVPEGPRRFKGCEPGYRWPVDRAEAPEAEASWKVLDTPICRRSVLARVFAPDGKGVAILSALAWGRSESVSSARKRSEGRCHCIPGCGR
jgi:hypothetical protein